MCHLQLQDSLREQEPELWITPIFGDTGGADNGIEISTVSKYGEYLVS
jgi:hypothetical protein